MRFAHFHSYFQRFKIVATKLTEYQQIYHQSSFDEADLENGLTTPTTQCITTRRMSLPDLPRFELESISNIIRQQRELLPFYKSEPKVLYPPALPDRLLQESLHWQQQAVKNLQVMYWVVESCDGTQEVGFDEAIHYLSKKIRRRTNSEGKFVLQSQESSKKIDVSSMFKTFDQSSNRLRAMTTLPVYESLLLPLEGEFQNVEEFVSNSLVFLSVCIQQLQQERHQSFPSPCSPYRDDRSQKPLTPSNPLMVLHKFTHERFRAAIQSLNLAQTSDIENSSVNYNSAYFGEVQGEEVEKLFTAFQRIINSLQANILENYEQEHRDDISPRTKDLHHEHSHIVSNKEIKVVNALLSSTQDLVHALRSLASVISRMQAHRDIHLTQNARDL